MRSIKFVIAALSVVCVALGLTVGLQRLGSQGMVTLGAAGVPAVLVGLALALRWPFGRGLAGGALLAFLLVGMKTSEAEPLQNIMMAAFFGMLAAIVLLIRPERGMIGDEEIRR